MSSPSDRPSIPLELTLPANHPDLLLGLDSLLELGLISDHQVRQIARSQLSCPYQPQVVESPIPPRPVTALVPEPVARPADRATPIAPVRPAQPSLISQVLSSFMEEISVVWLLFLGVFLVVVSSAVLAASQWQNVSPVGQYGILWAYTIALGLVSSLTGQHRNLRLTSRMLQIATLLIIPVNFWMMDGFRIWQEPLGWGVGAVGTMTLLGLQFQLLRQSARLQWINNVLLSLLQWGWILPGIPLIASYAGPIATVGLQVAADRRSAPPSDPDLSPPNRPPVDVGQVAIAFATLLLVGRAIWGQGIPLSALGLALGLCGWLLGWQNRHLSRPLWSQIGAGLLGFGWLITIATDFQWQALGISGLGLQLLWTRLHRRWDLATTLGLIVVGMQSYALLPSILPTQGRTRIMAVLTQWANLQFGAWELTGLGFFLSLLGLLGWATYLKRQRQPHLAATTETIALAWGLTLALPGLLNPAVRTSYFLLATLLLTGVLRRRASIPSGLIYLTHLTGLLTGLTGLAWGWPNLSSLHWAVVYLGLVGAEWLGCLVLADRTWAKSAWYIGLGLAGLGYIALNQAWLDDHVQPEWGLLALEMPILLMLLSRSPAFSRVSLPQVASWLSVATTLLALMPTVGDLNLWLVAVGMGTVLMLANTELLRHLWVASLTVGYGLALITSVGWRVWDPLPLAWLLPWIAGLICLLWLVWNSLRMLSVDRPAQPPTDARPTLILLYRRTTDYWAIGLTGLSLLAITGLATVEFLLSPSLYLQQTLLAIILLTGAIAVRTTVQPTDVGWLGLAWGVELLIAYMAELGNYPIAFRAMANLALGLGSQLGGDLWRRSRQTNPPLLAIHLVPPLYAGFGAILGHSTFTALTGLYTLAAALPILGVGRRQPQFKLLTYLGLIASSIGAYELLLYQVLQAPSSGHFGDAITLFAALTTAIAVGYRSLARWLEHWLRLEPEDAVGLTLIHWGMASLLLFLAWITPLSGAIETLWIGIAAVLGGYALWEGRRQSLWIYPGVVELWAAIAAALHQVWPPALGLAWVGATATVVAFCTDVLPWRRWGWNEYPLRQASACLPAVAILITLISVNIQSLLIAGTFYAWLARLNQQIRLSYVGLLLGGWAIVRLFERWGFRDPLWFVAILSGAGLFIIHVDPDLQPAQRQETRHWLRCLATGLFCLTALYQSELVVSGSVDRWLQGLLTIGFGLGLVLAGLIFRTRAFLYMGTLTFIIKVLRQLWLFIADHSLALWALGIVLGLGLIWIAATFEARRHQAIALLQYWLTELELWE